VYVVHRMKIIKNPTITLDTQSYRWFHLGYSNLTGPFIIIFYLLVFYHI